MRGNEIPRRNRLYDLTAAERAVYGAKAVVEAAGCDPRLTAALIKLHDAQELVADFVDGIDSKI